MHKCFRFSARVFVSSVKKIFYASILKLLTKYIADAFLLTDQVKKRIYHVEILYINNQLVN